MDEEGRHYYYDEANRLVEVRAADDVTALAAYTYDALGRRVTSTIGGVTTRYYYSGRQVIEERNTADQRLRFHIPGSLYIDEQVATYTDATGQFSYYLLGKNYTAVGAGNADGTVIVGDWIPADFNHDGFVDGEDVLHLRVCMTGENQGPPDEGCGDADLDYDGDVDQADFAQLQACLSGSYMPVDPACVEAVNGGFALHGLTTDVLPDGKTLVFARARHYDPKHGRWLQRDPLGYVDGPNLYEAFGGNAMTHVDPSGQVIDPFSAAGIGVAALIYLLWPPDEAVAPQGTLGEREWTAIRKQQTERDRYIFVATVFLFPVGSAAGGSLGTSLGTTVTRATGSRLAGTAASIGTRYATTVGIVTAGQEATLSASVAITEGPGAVSQLYDDRSDLKRIGVESLFNLGLTGAVDLISAAVARPRAAIVEIEGRPYVAVSGGSRMTVSEASRLTGMSEIEVANASSGTGSLTVVRPMEGGGVTANASGRLVIDRYGALKNSPEPGQAHHLNQAAAYRNVIPVEEGASIKLEGNILSDVGAPHTLAHTYLEDSFWSLYRGPGLTPPTNLQYTLALQRSLRAAGLSEAQVQQAVRAAIRERVESGLLGGQPVPNVPKPIRNLVRQP